MRSSKPSLPFIVYSLPRSRSAWTAKFLSYGGRKCAHDIATECASLNELTAKLRGEYAGTCETGAVIGWRALRLKLPDARIAVIRRPVQQAYDSLARYGVGCQEVMNQLTERDAMLDQLSLVPGVKSFAFADLKSIDTCRDLFEHCLGEPFDWEWWERWSGENVQVDVMERLRYVAANRDRIEGLKREARAISCATSMH